LVNLFELYDDARTCKLQIYFYEFVMTLRALMFVCVCADISFTLVWTPCYWSQPQLLQVIPTCLLRSNVSAISCRNISVVINHRKLFKVS